MGGPAEKTPNQRPRISDDESTSYPATGLSVRVLHFFEGVFGFDLRLQSFRVSLGLAWGDLFWGQCFWVWLKASPLWGVFAFGLGLDFGVWFGFGVRRFSCFSLLTDLGLLQFSLVALIGFVLARDLATHAALATNGVGCPATRRHPTPRRGEETHVGLSPMSVGLSAGYMQGAHQRLLRFPLRFQRFDRCRCPKDRRGRSCGRATKRQRALRAGRLGSWGMRVCMFLVPRTEKLGKHDEQVLFHLI